MAKHANLAGKRTIITSRRVIHTRKYVVIIKTF